jgi:hypothetical protein
MAHGPKPPELLYMTFVLADTMHTAFSSIGLLHIPVVENTELHPGFAAKYAEHDETQNDPIVLAEQVPQLSTLLDRLNKLGLVQVATLSRQICNPVEE